MKKSIVILVSLLFATSPVFSGAISNSFPAGSLTSMIEGRVLDAATREPLMGVNVMIENTSIGAATGPDGTFLIPQAPAGEMVLVASMMGYAKGHEIVTTRPNESVEVVFSLQQTILEMGAVVVTGTGTPHLYEDMPVKTSIIPRKIIESNQSCNVAEALSLTTGVRVENDCQNCNFSQVRILGMDGKYSQILVDGDPVVSSLAGVYGLEQIPEEMIDQIEVVKGGGSSLYGGGAVAGVVNMRLRRPVTNQVRLRSVTQSMDGTIDQRVGATAEFVNRAGTSSGFVFGSGRVRDAFDYNDDGYSELGELSNESFGFNWFLTPGTGMELATHIHRIHEKRRGGNKFDLPHHEAQISEALDSERWGGSVKWNHRISSAFDYRLFYSFANTKRNSYYGGLGTETPTAADSSAALAAYGITKNPLNVLGGQANWMWGRQLVTFGLQHTRELLEDKATANPLYYINDEYINTGFFVQDNFHIGPDDNLELVAGVRVDNHSEIEDVIVSPRLNLMWKITHDLKFRGAYTTGFKPPQVYDEDLHLCGIGGEQRVTRNSNDLKPEKSQSFSASLDYSSTLGVLPVIVGVTGFHTALTEAFSEREVGTVDDVTYFERINSGEASVSGVEFDLGLKPSQWMELRSGWTFKTSEYDEVQDLFEDEEGHVIASSKKFLRTPDVYGYLWANLILARGVSSFLSLNYTGEADVPHEGKGEIITSDSYLELDLGVNFSVHMFEGVQTRFNVGVKNITDAYQSDLDKGAERDPAYVFGPGRPRTLMLGVEALF